MSTGDFEYGNTRLRARRAALLAPGDYDAMLGRDLDGVLSALDETPYRAELEAARSRAAGLRALHEGVRQTLSRRLDESRRMYRGTARALVDVLLARFDLQNVLALLRARARGADPAEALSGVVAVGAFDEAAAREVAEREDLGAAVDLLRTWRLPDPATAKAVGRAWPEYERTEDLAALEQAVTAAHAGETIARLERLGAAAEPLRTTLHREVDARNVMVALRLQRSAHEGDDAAADEGALAHLVPGGRARRDRLAEAAAHADRGEAARGLAQEPALGRWSNPLERYGAGGDLGRLQRDLDADRAREAMDLFMTGDPLGVAVPVAYVASLETEARNLRLVGAAAAGLVDAADARDELILGGRR